MPLLFELPGNETFGGELADHLEVDRATVTLRNFPDGETYVRVDDEMEGRRAIVLATLDRPDAKVLPLFLLADTLRDLGASEVGLVAPYLAYMRQDKRFRPGEGITSRYFANMVSDHLDWLVTVDPHLHRYDSLDAIYEIPSRLVHAAPRVADWVAAEVDRPLVIGPDGESEQWVAEVADLAGAPYVVLEKVRSGDRQVDVSVPDVDRWTDHTPVLVDDIISTGGTMIQTTGHLLDAGMRAPVCIGVHGILAGAADEALLEAGADRVVTTDTIAHPTNAISVAEDVAEAIDGL